MQQNFSVHKNSCQTLCLPKSQRSNISVTRPMLVEMPENHSQNIHLRMRKTDCTRMGTRTKGKQGEKIEEKANSARLLRLPCQVLGSPQEMSLNGRFRKAKKKQKTTTCYFIFLKMVLKAVALSSTLPSMEVCKVVGLIGRQCAS